MSGCREVVTLLDAYADGELQPEQVLEIEAHLADCKSCGTRLSFDHAVRKSLRRTVTTAAVASDAFRERLVAQMKAEASRAEALPHLEASRRGAMLSWNSILPLAAAAAFAMYWSASKPQEAHKADPGTPVTNKASADPLNIEQMLDALVDRHIERDAPSVTQPELLDDMDAEVGVPVHAPSLAQYGARWEGGRIVPARKNHSDSPRLASLRYKVGGHRMTLYVFDSERFPLNSERIRQYGRFTKRVVGTEPVYTSWKRGFSIAAKEQRGVGYAVATDLGEAEGAEIVASLQ